mgnify:CR=1 FL=1
MKITLFYDHVTVLDYAYFSEHLGPVGHSQVVDVEFIGKTDHEGMLYDFSLAKKKVKEIIDRECDHRFVVPKAMTTVKDGQAHIKTSFGFGDEEIEYWCPAEGICEIPFAHVSDATLVTHLEELVMKEMPETVSAIKLSLRSETLEPEASFFHYTHGLKDHYGNCQRLIHGHRSTLNIYRNSVRDYELEELLATDTFSSCIHFVMWDNIVNKDEIIKSEDMEHPVGRLPNTPVVHITYESEQGVFTAKLPGKICYITPKETTVENLSIHFCSLIKSEYALENEQITVNAFEGIGKGSTTTIV